MPLSISNSNSFVSADVIYNRLISKVEFVQTHISQYCLNPGKDFSRKGKWDFKTIFSWYILNDPSNSHL